MVDMPRFETWMLRCLVLLIFAVSSDAAVHSIQFDNAYAWRKPGTPLTYQKNACLEETYKGGYAVVDSSFDQVYESAKKHHYKGGHCEVTRAPLVSTIPGTFPKTERYADWVDPTRTEAVVTRVSHECTLSDNTSYRFDIDIEPMLHCVGAGCYADRPYCLADIIARDLDIKKISFVGHTALYAGAHVLEVLDDDAPELIHMSTIDGFKQKTPYWGSRYGLGRGVEKSYTAAAAILNVGFNQRQFFPEYTLLPIYKEGHFYVDNEQIYYDKGLFRCDTFVKYMYKKGLNEDVPPFKLYDTPYHQWKYMPHQRQAEWMPETPLLDPSLASLSAEQRQILGIMGNKQLSDAGKSAQLMALQKDMKDRDGKLMTYDAIRLMPTRENFAFLLDEYEQYQDMQDTRFMLRLLSALRYQYQHFKSMPKEEGLKQELDKVKDIYRHVFKISNNPVLVKRVIEDATIIFDPEEAYRTLSAVDSSLSLYRSAYLTSMLMTYINNHQTAPLVSLVESMNGCELQDNQALFDAAQTHGLISEHQFNTIQGAVRHAPHAPNCLHQAW